LADLHLVPDPPEPERQSLVGEYWPLAAILVIIVASLTIWALQPPDHTAQPPGYHTCVASDC